MNEKVSVVVPVYNVEDYLDKCVKSIVSQTYENLEIILVDDGATDRSSRICDQWAVKDNRIKVIHKKNGGLSSARNAGMDNATGNYIMFEDSDDWLEVELIEKCVNRIQKSMADMVIFGYKKVDEIGNCLEELTFGSQNLSKKEMTNQLFKRITEMSFGYAWNKMYDLNSIRKSGIKFDSGIVDREDLVFNMQLLKYLNKISYLEFVGYSYLQRGTSLLHNADLARIKNVKPFCHKMYNIDLDDMGVKKKVYNMNVLHYLSDCIIKNILWNEELGKKEKIQWMRDIINECPNRERLYDDPDNPKHLKVLYKAISSGRPQYFYRYVWLSGVKRKILGLIIILLPMCYISEWMNQEILKIIGR